MEGRGPIPEQPTAPRRGRRLAALVAAVFVLAATAGWLALPEIARRVVVWRLAALTGRPVALAALELDLLGGRLAARGLRVADPDGQALLALDRLELRVTLRALLRGHLRIDAVTVEAPTLRLARIGPGEFNVTDLVRRAPRGRGPLAVTVERLVVTRGSVLVEDRTLAPPRVWRVAPVTVEAHGLSTRADAPPGTLALRAEGGAAHLAAWVSELRLGPARGHVTVVLRDADARLAALALPPASPVLPSAGRVDLSATVVHDPAAGSRVAGDAVVSGLELLRPGGARPLLTAPAVRVRVEDLRVGGDRVALGRLLVDGGTAVLEDARLGAARRWAVEGLRFELRNVARAPDAPPGTGVAHAVVAGAPVTAWLAGLRVAPLELHATAVVRDLDLALLALSGPAGLPVQPERGRLSVTVRLDHDARQGTRAALDATLRNLALRRAPWALAAPVLRVTADAVTLARTGVRIGRAALQGDRLTLEAPGPQRLRSWAVQDVALEARDLSSRPGDVQGIVTARARVAGATVAAWVTHARLAPLELRATAILRALDAGLVQLALPAEAPLAVERGIVDASAQVDHDATGTRLAGDVTVRGLRAQGRGRAAGLALDAPSLRLILAEARRRGAELDVGRVELTGSAAIFDTRAPAARVDLERLRLAGEGLTWPIRGPAHIAVSARTADGGALDARGTALLTAPPPLPAWTTDLEIRVAGLELRPLAAFLPATAGLSGRLGAALRATVAHGASLTARVQGEASLVGAALVEGGRTVLAVPRLEAAALDLHWPERLAVGRLRLERPRALVERDARGAIPLVARLTAGVGSSAAGTAPSGRPRLGLSADDVVVEGGRLVYADASGARVEVPRLDLTLRDARWPATVPARVRLDATLAAGGSLGVEGTVTGEPAAVDVTLRLIDAELAALQPALPFRAAVRGRVDARLAVAGPLAPTPRLAVRGEAAVRHVVVSDGPRPVLTVERLEASAVDAAWPGRVTIGRVHVRRSWALIERDRQGRFVLREAFQRLPRPLAPPAAPAGGAPPTLELHVGQSVFEDGAASILDAAVDPPVRLEVAGARLTVRDLRWPGGAPVAFTLATPTPGGGRLEADGALTPEPLRVEAQARLEDVDLAPAHAYVPIEGRLGGRLTGRVGVTLALDPLALRVTGDLRAQRVRLADADRPVATARRVEITGIDVDWPSRVHAARVVVGSPRVLLERHDADGWGLLRLARPRRGGREAGAPAPGARAPARPTPALEVDTVTVEAGSVRVVDGTTTPPAVLELTGVEASVRGLTTAPGRPARVTARGALEAGARVELTGQAALAEPRQVDLTLHLRDVPLARANPYLARVTAWTATRGTVSGSAHYRLDGARLDASHELVLRHLEVRRDTGRDEVAERLGLPLGFLVALLKDARGEIRLSLPVSGDLASGAFDFREAVWGAVRALAFRLLALPFSRVGSLFVTEDSRVEAVVIAPVLFEPGRAEPAPGMRAHLDRVAALLRNAPALTVRLAPVVTRADLDALKRERVRARLAGGADAAAALDAARRAYRERWPEQPPPATLEAIVAALAGAEELPPTAARELGTRRVEVVRQLLAARGVDGARLRGPGRGPLLVEGAGAARVEFALEP